MARKNVSTAAVRAWGKDNLDLIPEAGHLSIMGKNGDGKPRGRVHPEVVKAFHKANKSKVYAPKVAEEGTVTFRGAFTDASGRRNTKVVTLTVSEARTLLGHEPGRKGRLAMGLLKDAWEAAQDAPVAKTA